MQAAGSTLSRAGQPPQHALLRGGPRVPAGVPVGLGLVASVVLVVAAGRSSLPVGVELGRGFWGLLDPSRTGGTVAASLVVLALTLLVCCWWSLLRRAGRGELSVRTVVVTGALWCLPLLVSPALLSLDAYSYLAQGRMVAAGVDAYAGGPVLLGDDAAGWTDPVWRSSPVPYGPITLLLLRAVALVSSDPTTGVLVLRAGALLGVLAATAAALPLLDRAGQRRRAHVLVLVLLNPVTLVHLVGGAHVDAVLAGAVGLCVLALVRGRVRTAWALSAVAVAIKVTAAPLVAFCLLAVLDRRRARLATLALAAVPFLVALPVVPRPWGFVSALTVPGAEAPWYSPGAVAGLLLVGLSRVLALPFDEQVLRTAGRLAVLAVGAVVVLRLLRAERRDELEDPGADRASQTARRIGLSLLVVTICLPAVHGWYLASAVATLAVVGTAGQVRLLVVLSSALAFSSLPPLYAVDRPVFATTCVLALVAGLGYLRVSRDPRPASTAQPSSASPAGGSHRQLTGAAGLAGATLLCAVGVGAITPAAGAETSAVDEARAAARVADRGRIIEHLRRAYPTLKVLRVDASSPGPSGTVRVRLVHDERQACTVLLTRVGSGFVRASDAVDGRTARAIDEQACLPPVPVASR